MDQPPAWKLEIFDRDGLVIAAVCKAPNGPPKVFGDVVSAAHAASEVRNVPQFFTDPEAIGRAAYNAWRDLTIARQTDAGAPFVAEPHTWEALKELAGSASSVHLETISRWVAIGKAAVAVPPTCN